MFERTASALRKLLAVISVAVFLSWATNGNAQDTNRDFTGYLYLWAPALSGETTTGGSIDVSFSDILDNLDVALMGAVEARRGRFSIFADALYLDLSDGQDTAVGPGIPANADVDVRGTVLSGSVGYDLANGTDMRIAVLGGFRVMNLDTSANVSIASGSQRISGGINNWDAIVGVRGTTQIADRWGVSYYADIGAGESDLTAQLSAAVNYRINTWDLVFGYRYLNWDLGNTQVLSDLTFQGPFIGARFGF
jgi:hypothetical protein